MTSFSAAAAAYGCVAVGIHLNNGLYTPAALALIVVGVAAVWFGVRRASHASITETTAIHVLTAAVAILAVAGMSLRPLLYREGVWFAAVAKSVWFLMFAFVLGAGILGEISRRRVFLFVLAAAITVRFLVPLAAPSPRIDVFVFSQESATNLLAGLNPYDTPVSSPYEGEHFGYDIPSYPYPPASLYLQVIGRVFGDVRVASALAEAATALLLLTLAGRSGGRRIAELIALLYLAHPRGPFIVEQAWTEVLALPFFAGALVAAMSERRALAAAAFGFMISIKQSLLFFPIFGALVERRPRYVALAVLAGVLTLVPFLIWDAGKLITNGLLFQFGTPFRPETLTIFAPLADLLSIQPVRGWTIFVGFAAAIAALVACRTLDPVRGCAWSAAAGTLTMFAFGDKAWANYYYFAGGLIVIALAVEAKRIQRVNQEVHSLTASTTVHATSASATT